MSRGRGRGRGRGGGGGGQHGSNQGSFRGRGGHQHSWGQGRALDDSLDTSLLLNSGSQRGRGRGRGGGGPVRGSALRASRQNAVGFNYGTPTSASGSNTPIEATTASDQDDVVLETHRKYQHVVKPHLQNDEAPRRYTPTVANGTHVQMMLPPSVSNIYARAPSNTIAMEKAQRAMEGQVAGLIPTGPKSAHIHRMYGTLDTVRNLQKSRSPQPHYPLPVISKAGEKRHKIKADRPMEDTNKDPYLAGVPRTTSRFTPNAKEHFFRNGSSSGLTIPVKFAKATGEWRDGAWVRGSDGKETVTAENLRGKQEANGQRSDPFDRAAGAGLGYHHKARDAHKEVDASLLKRDNLIEEDVDPVEALLRAFPGSSEVQGNHSDLDDNAFGFYQGDFTVPVGTNAHGVVAGVSHISASDEDSGDDKEVDEAMDTTYGVTETLSDDDEEEILIPQSSAVGESTRLVQSDSEEERQLNAIIEREQSRVRDTELKPADSFFMDLTGEQEEEDQEKVAYDSVHGLTIGQMPSAEDANDGQVDDQKDEDIPTETAFTRAAASKNARRKAKRRAKRAQHSANDVPIAREGDSDLEWGSDGPPVHFRRKADQDAFIEGSAVQHSSLEAPRDGKEEEEMLALALVNSIAEPKTRSAGKAGKKQSAKEAILADYMENPMGLTSDDESSERRDESKINEKTNMDALLHFMNGMDGQGNGRIMTLEDIAIERQMEEEDEWMTESDDYNHENEEVEAAIQEEEKKLEVDQIEMEAGSVDDESESESDDKSDSGENDARQRKKRQESWSDSEDSEDESDDDDDDDDEAFVSWADADEDFISRLDKFANANDGILKGRDRKARNKLFKMIESGDFGDLDEEDMIIDNDDPVFGLGALQPMRGGKNVRKPFNKDHLWAEELQSQWEKDRATKAANKRKRAAERAAAAQNPFHATQIKKGTKKMAKKAARAERRSLRRSDPMSRYGDADNDGDDDDDDDVKDYSSGPLSRHAANLIELDQQIQLFLRDASKTTLSLAPMDKRARAQVHLLANSYNLISKSKGNGNTRFPTLIKNSRSGLNVNMKKINSILRGASGSFGTGFKGRGAGGSLNKVKDRASGVGAHVPKNQEGAAVGFGAERIGNENIGHRLLSMMGWSEGMGVGLTQGAADPIGATIKVTKGGLGF